MRRFLGEFRMLVTAVGVLVAFQLQAAFSPAFLDADPALQRLHLGGTLFGVAAFACFLIPASVHRVASEVRNADAFITLARRSIGSGFVLLGIALVLGVMVHAGLTVGFRVGVIAAALTLAMLIVAWALVPWRFDRANGPS